MLRHISTSYQTFTIQCPNPDIRNVSVRHACMYHEVPWWMFIHNAGVAMAHKLYTLPPAQTILDIGCGLGLTAVTAQSLGHTTYVTDIFNECYEYVTLNAQLNDVVPPQWINSINDIPSNSLDYVLMSEVLYNRNQTRQTLVDIVRCIKPTGKLLIAEPPRISETNMIKLFDIFKREYTKDTIVLNSIADPSEVKDDYTKIHIYTFEFGTSNTNTPEINTYVGQECVQTNLYDVVYLEKGEYQKTKICTDYYVCSGSNLVCE